jgi:GTP cyclohydrolase I
VERAFEYLTKGYKQDPEEILNQAKFTEEDYQEMVVVRDIDFFSMCEHHILPFFGRANVAYNPRHHIVGLSQNPRLVEVFSRRLQVQERLTTQIANTIMEVLDPLGVGVVIRAERPVRACVVWKTELNCHHQRHVRRISYRNRRRVKNLLRW